MERQPQNEDKTDISSGFEALTGYAPEPEKPTILPEEAADQENDDKLTLARQQTIDLAKENLPQQNGDKESKLQQLSAQYADKLAGLFDKFPKSNIIQTEDGVVLNKSINKNGDSHYRLSYSSGYIDDEDRKIVKDAEYVTYKLGWGADEPVNGIKTIHNKGGGSTMALKGNEEISGYLWAGLNNLEQRGAPPKKPSVLRRLRNAIDDILGVPR